MNTIIVDPENEEFVLSKKWRPNTGGHLMTGTEPIYLTHFVLGRFPGFNIDHIDRNLYNNKRKNLRVVTIRANKLNHGNRCINAIRSCCYIAYIGREKFRIGQFSTYKEAASAYDKVHIRMFITELLKTRDLNLHLTDGEFYNYVRPLY